MTRKEAVARIKDHMIVHKMNEPRAIHISKALDMAIKTLEQDPKIGHWIDTDSKSYELHRVYKCSECGNTEIEYPEGIHRHFRYCPNCGAKMEVENDT